MYQIARYTDENIGGTGLMWDILANETHQVKKVLIASSRSIYGEGTYLCTANCGQVVPNPRTKTQLTNHQWSPSCPKCGATVKPIATPEHSPPQPASLYACTKLAQEQICLTMGQALNIPTVALRFQNVYGPGQSLRNPYTGIISIFSNQMRQNIPIDIYEDGQETRDFIFVEDVADICARALSLECETLLLNVGSGMATPVIDLAEKLKHLWESNSEIQITGNFRVGDIRHNWADLTALHEVFPDWEPTSLATGLESFVTWAQTQEIYEDRSKAATQELKQRNLWASSHPPSPLEDIDDRCLGVGGDGGDMNVNCGFGWVLFKDCHYLANIICINPPLQTLVQTDFIDLIKTKISKSIDRSMIIRENHEICLQRQETVGAGLCK